MSRLLHIVHPSHVTFCLLLQQHQAHDCRGVREQPPGGVATGKVDEDGDEEGGPDGLGWKCRNLCLLAQPSK